MLEGSAIATASIGSTVQNATNPQGRLGEPRASGAEPVAGGFAAPRAADAQESAFVYPPTRKKIGITWKIHRRDLEVGGELQEVLADERAVAKAEHREQPVTYHDQARSRGIGSRST